MNLRNYDMPPEVPVYMYKSMLDTFFIPNACPRTPCRATCTITLIGPLLPVSYNESRKSMKSRINHLKQYGNYMYAS